MRLAQRLLTRDYISPPFISWLISLTIKSLSNQPIFPLQTHPYIYIYIRLHIPRLLKPSYKLPFDAIKPLKLTYISAAQSFTYISTLLSRLVTVALLLYYRRVAIISPSLLLLTRSRILLLLRPSFKLPRYTKYQIGPQRGLNKFSKQGLNKSFI